MSKFTVFILCLLLMLPVQLSYAAQLLHKDVQMKSELALTKLKAHLERGDKVAPIIEKMQRVKQLGRKGKLHKANLLLDVILQDFLALEQQNKQRLGAALFVNDKPVYISGYNSDVMEPFITRDGKYMFFNDFQSKAHKKDMFYASRVDDYHFKYMGPIQNINTGEVEGVPSMDDAGNFYYISTEQYKMKNLVTAYVGRFVNGEIVNIRPLPELSKGVPGWLNMDLEISADGQTLYSTQSHFKGDSFPDASYFFYAKKIGDTFVPQEDSAYIFKELNKDPIIYAAALSRDELEIMYTRLTIHKGRHHFDTLRATRTAKDQPFGTPVVMPNITGFSEAPAMTDDGKIVYYHKKDITGKKLFQLHALHRKQ